MRIIECDINISHVFLNRDTFMPHKKITIELDVEYECCTGRMTPEQIEEYRARRLPKVYIGTRSRNKKITLYSYWREGNMAPWFREYDHELLANLEYEY